MKAAAALRTTATPSTCSLRAFHGGGSSFLTPCPGSSFRSLPSPPPRSFSTRAALPQRHKTNRWMFSSASSSLLRASTVVVVGGGALLLSAATTNVHAHSYHQERGGAINSIYDFTVLDMDGQPVDLARYKGKVLVIVNVASLCGATNCHYTQLEQLYQKYKDQGLVVLGFPCNQFGKQEPGSNEDIKLFLKDFEPPVTFPVFDKVEVNGPNTHPLFKYLKETLPGVLGTTDIKWNFTKFLIGRDGKPLQRFGTNTTPNATEQHIISALQQPSPPKE
ncbi:Glutathione peroxidase [Balamuthia mandrillaris]